MSRWLKAARISLLEARFQAKHKTLRILAHLKARGFSNAEAAKIIEVTPQTVAKWLKTEVFVQDVAREGKKWANNGMAMDINWLIGRYTRAIPDSTRNASQKAQNRLQRHLAGETYSAIARSEGVTPWAVQKAVRIAQKRFGVSGN